MFNEIKKKRPQLNILKKDNTYINFQTEFQELMYLHSKGKKSQKYCWKVMNDEMYENAIEKQEIFVEEIIKQDEVLLFDLYRWYKNYQEDNYVPKSSILGFLFWIDLFVKNHCMTICKSIESKCNNENFLDEYSTRWKSFTSLIEIFETEFSFIEVMINSMYNHDDIQKGLGQQKSNQPRFTFLRLMWRAWGKYVMKKLFPKFSERVMNILVNYQNKLSTLIENYHEIKKEKKYFANFLKNNYSLSQIQKGVLSNALQMVMDVSINEYCIKDIENSHVSLNVFYPKLEQRIMKQTKPFLKDLFTKCSPEIFQSISQLYMSTLNDIMIRHSQRRLHNLVYATIWINTENRIRKLYIEYSMEEYQNKNEETKTVQNSLPLPKPIHTLSKSTFRKQPEKDIDPEVTPVQRWKQKDDKIVQFIQGIIQKPYLKAGRNSKLLRNNTHADLIYKTPDEEEEEEKNIEIRYTRNTKIIEDSSSENNEIDDSSEIEDEPKINILRSHRTTLNPFRNSSDNAITESLSLELPEQNEKEISLAFYEHAMKNHKKLFDNLRVSYQQWKEGIDGFNSKDDKSSAFSKLNVKSTDERIETVLWESLYLIRSNTTKDPIYNEFKPNYEDVYYHPFDENDDQLREFLLEEQDNDSMDDDFDDIGSDFWDWL